MLKLFRRRIRKKTSKPQRPKCNHWWTLNDYYYVTIDNGCDVDIEDRYVLWCSRCKGTTVVDNYQYGRMKTLGLIHKGDDPSANDQ